MGKKNASKKNISKKNISKKNASKKNIKPCNTQVIYLDNNGTTKLCKQSHKVMDIWLDSRSNPSANSVIAKRAKEMIECVKKHILKHCDVTKGYSVIFTSGASESNSFILRSVAEAFKKEKNRIPHIITSSTEHKSIIKCCNELRRLGTANITYIEPNAYGCIDPTLVKKSITKDTALISIIAANNELGCINNIKSLGDIAHSKNIPFHTDAVQLFGKYKLPIKGYVDALSMSFHKLYGPMGLGILLLNDELVNGYGLAGQISGPQQGSLRGGTENVPSIAAALACMKSTFKNRNEKNKKMFTLKKRIIDNIKKEIPLGEYKSYFSNMPIQNEFIVLGPRSNNSVTHPNVLPNTLLLSFAKNTNFGKPNYVHFCNVKLKEGLDKKNIIISIGSACSTDSKKASHVMYAIKAPAVIKNGVIRVSLSDNTTLKEINTFSKELLNLVTKQFNL